MADLLFHNLVETIYNLPLEEREELQLLLINNITDSRRNEMVANSLLAKEEKASNQLQFSLNINDLKKML